MASSKQRGKRVETPAPRDASTRPRLGAALLVFFSLFALYLTNLRVMGAADSLPTRRIPLSILREGNIDLDEFSWDRTRSGRLPYYLRERGGHLYSGSPIATPLVVTPLFAVPAWIIHALDLGPDDVRTRLIEVAAERVSAAFLAALSAVLVYLALCRIVAHPWALGLALYYGVGTSTWSISSQALWPHALAQICLAALCALFLARNLSRSAALWASVLCVLAVVNRPTMVVFAAVSLVFVWRERRSDLLAFLVVPVAGAVAFGLYNSLYYGQLTGGYGVTLGQFSGGFQRGLLGLLISPNRGLLIFTPVFLFAVPGAVRAWRAVEWPWLRYLIVGVLLHLLVFGQFEEWWAGYTYGPRYLTDALPALIILLAFGLVPIWRATAVRVVACALMAFGVFVQAVGTYCADDAWNREPVPLERAAWRVWDWSDLQIVRALRSGFRGAELSPLLVDSFRDPVPAVLRPLTAQDLSGEVEVESPPERLRRAQSVPLELQVTNRGDAAWPAFNGLGKISVRYLVMLVATWLRDGRPVPGVGEVVRLPQDLAPGETGSVEMPLTAPSSPGVYEVRIRVTQAIDGRTGVPGRAQTSFRVAVD